MEKNEKYRVTKISSTGTRVSKTMSDTQLQLYRAQRMKEMRKKELGLTQKDLAEAVGVNLRTLQDWESGRSPMPKPVEKLMILMKKMPIVKKHLLANA